MTAPPPAQPMILCMAGYEKGHDFLREAKRLGCHVILLTNSDLEEAGWPRESIDELFHMPTTHDVDAVLNGVSYLARERAIDRIVALDDFDVETAATLREHFRMPGMGATLARRFRDKLAMRVSAREAGIAVPDFVGIFNYDRLREFMARVPAPWMLKPRSEAAAVGISKLHTSDDLWPVLDRLGDKGSRYLLERYVPGDVFHVDAIVHEREVCFAEAHAYGQPPLDVAHGGGVFITRTVRRGSDDERQLLALNRQVIAALGLERGVTHAEYIKGRDDGRLYFLEIAARVGGAHIADGIEAGTGVNLWAEWAKIEVTQVRGEVYRPPSPRRDHMGVIISLARQERPDMGAYHDPEIVWRIDKPHHAGMIVVSPDAGRVTTLLDDYARRFHEDFVA
ncbi:MAG: ATPase, partial [Chloroflexota bacterium]|nr:ATPase [Chloroflexota bacterium]